MQNLDDMSDAELKTYLAGLQKIGLIQGRLMKAAKAEAQRRRIGLTVADHAYFDGEQVGTILATHDGKGEYKVTDPVAYANVLHDIDARIPGDRPAWQEAWYPRPEAMTGAYLEDLIREHGGEIPAGVEYKPGRAGTITIRLDRAFAHSPLTVESFVRGGLLETGK